MIYYTSQLAHTQVAEQWDWCSITKTARMYGVKVLDEEVGFLGILRKIVD